MTVWGVALHAHLCSHPYSTNIVAALFSIDTEATASSDGVDTTTLADLLSQGVPLLERTSSCTPSSHSQSISAASPSSKSAVRKGKKVALRGEWRVHNACLSLPTTVTAPSQHRAVSLYTLRANSQAHLMFGNEASLQEKFNTVVQDLVGLINVRDVVNGVAEYGSVHNHQEIIPDLTFVDRRTGQPVLFFEFKVPATARGTHAHSKPNVAAQLRLQCDRQYFLGIEHPCVVLLDGATMSVAWRPCDDGYFQSLVGATSSDKRENWPESFRDTLRRRQGDRRVRNFTPTTTQRKDPQQVTPPRRNDGLPTPIYGTGATATPAATHLAPTDAAVLSYRDAREAHEAGVAIDVVMHRTLVHRVTTITGDGHGRAAPAATATGGGQRPGSMGGQRSTTPGSGGGGKGGQTTTEDLARVVEGESNQQRVLNACSLLELALATGARRCLRNEINVGTLSDLFVECYRPTSSEPTYQHWPAVNATYGMPGQCKNFARLRYLGEGADGEVGLYCTVPSGEPRSCRVFVAKSYKYHAPRPLQQEGWAEWEKARTEHMEFQAEHELTQARSLYCGDKDPLFPSDFFDVKVIKGQPMFCQPYFEPIPKEEREAALKQLPELLKRFTTRNLGYSFKDNEVHWRHFLKYMDGEVAKYILVDFCRLAKLQAIIDGLPEYRLRGVDRSALSAENLEQRYISLHCETLRRRMQQAAAPATNVDGITDAVRHLDVDSFGGGGGAAN